MYAVNFYNYGHAYQSIGFQLISDIENEILEIWNSCRMLEAVQNQIQVKNITPKYAYAYQIIDFRSQKLISDL